GTCWARQEAYFRKNPVLPAYWEREPIPVFMTDRTFLIMCPLWAIFWRIGEAAPCSARTSLPLSFKKKSVRKLETISTVLIKWIEEKSLTKSTINPWPIPFWLLLLLSC